MDSERESRRGLSREQKRLEVLVRHFQTKSVELGEQLQDAHGAFEIRESELLRELRRRKEEVESSQAEAATARLRTRRLLEEMKKLRLKQLEMERTLAEREDVILDMKATLFHRTLASRGTSMDDGEGDSRASVEDGADRRTALRSGEQSGIGRTTASIPTSNLGGQTNGEGPKDEEEDCDSDGDIDDDNNEEDEAAEGGVLPRAAEEEISRVKAKTTEIVNSLLKKMKEDAAETHKLQRGNETLAAELEEKRKECIHLREELLLTRHHASEDLRERGVGTPYPYLMRRRRLADESSAASASPNDDDSVGCVALSRDETRERVIELEEENEAQFLKIRELETALRNLRDGFEARIRLVEEEKVRDRSSEDSARIHGQLQRWVDQILETTRGLCDVAVEMQSPAIEMDSSSLDSSSDMNGQSSQAIILSDQNHGMSLVEEDEDEDDEAEDD